MSTENKFLRKKILHYFKLHTEIDSARVDIDIHHSVVTLSGKVNGPIAKATLEGLARTFHEVKDVINDLEIDSENITGVQGMHL